MVGPIYSQAYLPSANAWSANTAYTRIPGPRIAVSLLTYVNVVGVNTSEVPRLFSLKGSVHDLAHAGRRLPRDLCAQMQSDA
jgi:hypothetical protein